MNDAQPIAPESTSHGETGLVTPRDFYCKEPFAFQRGRSIPEFTLRYETYGRLNEQRDNTILICHALSGDHHCAGIHSLKDKKPGWWNNLIGPGKAIDTNRFFVLCSNCIGGCQGSTGPTSINPLTGQPWHLDFPDLTITDMVRAQHRLCQHLNLPSLYAVIGGSMGGMQALQWAIEYPDYVRRIIPMATTARQNAQAIAFNEVGRCAIMQDPNWNGGNYQPDHGPDVGLSIARMMAHITYLSDKGMESKFGRDRPNKSSAGQFEVEFEVESYLRYQGASFVNRFDANTYLYFSKALDRFDLYGSDNNLDAAMQPLRARALVIGFTSDWLFPPAQNRAIVHAMLRAGKDASYAEIYMDFGHDSFLVDAPELYELVSTFLDI